ncbi:hypothetical protein CJF30_00011227 [Rutstroemia sp. NJR-2017a BBW]|nr:hypothetical protein CJF30_00011227 [Rutstroemia sp. NJR-2017a BBW]
MATQLHGCRHPPAVINCREFLEFAEATCGSIDLGRLVPELPELARLSILAVQLQQLGQYSTPEFYTEASLVKPHVKLRADSDCSFDIRLQCCSMGLFKEKTNTKMVFIPVVRYFIPNLGPG